MPRFSKEVLTQFFGSECLRQLRLNLSPDKEPYRSRERTPQGMPPVQPPRPGLELIAQEGERWQEAKLHDLTQAFGRAALVGRPYKDGRGRDRYNPLPLAEGLEGVAADRFLVEAEYEVGPACLTALGIAEGVARHGLDFAAVRPDLIAVAPPGRFPRLATPAGEVEPLAADDERLQLRVIDIKLSAEPSPGHFAQVAYYTIALAGWLVDRGLGDRFVAVPEGAVWPGSHEAASLTRLCSQLERQAREPTLRQLLDALEEDLEPVPFEVFAYRVRRFLREDVPAALDRPWRDLPWHVDNRCKGCDYLGYPWKNKEGQFTNHGDHCIPEAERSDHLSRVAFISRGAGAALRDRGVGDVAALAGLPIESKIFEVHQTLRATRTVVGSRATALKSMQATIPEKSGASAIMPRWADLHVYLSTDFDVGSAITFAFGMRSYWIEPRPFGVDDPTPRPTMNWPRLRRSLVVMRKDPQAEWEQLRSLLEQIHIVLSEARAAHPESTVQFYLWDKLQYDHLVRVVGRHLRAILDDGLIRDLAWLFPPEELLPNPQLATRRSPITIVREVIRAVLAAPIPHYYTLLAVARAYHAPGLPEGAAKFSMHPLLEDPLSDQIPSERAHAIWGQITGGWHWQSQMEALFEAVEKRLSALATVVERLESDLRPLLGQTAPEIQIGPPGREARLSFDGQLWYAFARLDAALSELEVHRIRAMPPHEREARFKAARLRRRLVGAEEREALAALGLHAADGRRVYRMRESSHEVNLREGDFNYALSPELTPHFLDRSFAWLTRDAGLGPLPTWISPRTRMEEVTRVTVRAIDRERGLIALDADRSWPTVLDDLESAGIADFSAHAILDPIYKDYFSRKKLLSALKGIGNPPAAADNPLVRRAIGQAAGPGSRRTAPTPAADLLWGAAAMHAERVDRDLAPVRARMLEKEIDLNPSQWAAWEGALSRRLQLIWGPPGTGKSRTARAIVLGAVLEAHLAGRPIRVLICASTYKAMDNVLLGAAKAIRGVLPEETCEIRRLRNEYHEREEEVTVAMDAELGSPPTSAVLELRSRLARRRGTILVGGPPEQVHKLLDLAGANVGRALFDLILIDEASQMDVAHAILPLGGLAQDGVVVLAGDDKQLPPIHRAEPPLGLEDMVGSIYSFCKRVHRVEPVMLEVNYRSNRTMVEFAHVAGYGAQLSSHSPDLQLHFAEPLPVARPEDWPAELYWTPEWAALLDPGVPATCFVYREGRSSQWNRFEADAVAAMVYLLQGRLADRPAGERNAGDGGCRPAGTAPYTTQLFWERAVGVVTPHRAQQGLIVERLRGLFQGTGVAPTTIRGAVDTVERFQGQERDVIIATFALGDPDAIRDEDEFLMSLNRFNVMASRARAKLIVLVTQEVVDHLASDVDVLRESRLLKAYAESFCQAPRPMTLGYLDQGIARSVSGTFRRRR